MANKNSDNLASTIEPYHFISCQSDKTKFNWFAFELACEIESAIPSRLNGRLSKSGYTKQALNTSCIRLATLLQGVILKKLRNDIPEMQINYTEVEVAFPGLSDKIINELLDCTVTAWGNLLNICVSCPSACISHKNDYCNMFDDEIQ